VGTNYYFRTAICGECGRYDEVHICKSLTSFDTIRRFNSDSAEVEILVGSWAEWKTYLRNTVGRIYDEYGAARQVEEFIAAVEAVTPENRRWQYDWMVAHAARDVSEGPQVDKTWLDPDGYTFSGHGFS
jgi:hypothetical protein